MRVYELARQLSLTNDQIIVILQELGQDIKSHMKKLTKEQVEMVQNYSSKSTKIEKKVEKKVEEKLVECYTCFKDEKGHMVYKVLLDVNTEKHRLIPVLDDYGQYRSKVSPKLFDIIDRKFNHDKED